MRRVVRKGLSMVLGPDDGDSYWQPEPAHGYVTVKVSPFTLSSNSVSAGFQVIDPGGHIRAHAHERAEEMLFVWEGRGIAAVDGVEHPVEPGSLVYVDRFVEHSIINTGERQLKLLWIFIPPGLEDMLAAIGAPRIPGEPRPALVERPANARDIYERAWFARPEDIQRAREEATCPTPSQEGST